MLPRWQGVSTPISRGLDTSGRDKRNREVECLNLWQPNTLLKLLIIRFSTVSDEHKSPFCLKSRRAKTLQRVCVHTQGCALYPRLAGLLHHYTTNQGFKCWLAVNTRLRLRDFSTTMCVQGKPGFEIRQPCPRPCLQTSTHHSHFLSQKHKPSKQMPHNSAASASVTVVSRGDRKSVNSLLGSALPSICTALPACSF